MEEKKKIRVLAVPSDEGGCKYWRVERPHLKLDEMFGDDFDVVIRNDVNWRDLDYISSFDIIYSHKGLLMAPNETTPPDMEGFFNALDYCHQNNIVTIMDIDDYWHLGQYHPMNRQSIISKTPELLMDNLKRFDYITTTTEIFAKEIMRFNKNVEVYPNAIDTEDPQWKEDTSFMTPTGKIRFGFVMGSSHGKDMEQFQGVVNSLPKDVMDKIQIVLCGYDLRGTITTIGPDGQVQGVRNVSPMETVWYDYECNVTNNYRLCSPQYQQFLSMYMPDAQYPDVDNEFYRREWTKNLSTFGSHYEHIDVLLVPLNDHEFNKYKSELKIVEAGFKHKAIVMSEYGPYTIGTNSMFKKGGEIDPTGNCVLIEPRKAHKDWAKTIIKLTRNPELIHQLADNLHEHVKDTYNLETVTKKRAEWYKKIVRK